MSWRHTVSGQTYPPIRYETRYSTVCNTLGDHVVTNHAVVQMMCETLGHSLNELNCNVHPLDTLASQVRPKQILFPILGKCFYLQL